MSVKNCFIRGSVVRYVQMPASAVDTQLLEDATRRGGCLDVVGVPSFASWFSTTGLLSRRLTTVMCSLFCIFQRLRRARSRDVIPSDVDEGDMLWPAPLLLLDI
jgi:hypothetical protein